MRTVHCDDYQVRKFGDVIFEKFFPTLLGQQIDVDLLRILTSPLWFGCIDVSDSTFIIVDKGLQRQVRQYISDKRVTAITIRFKGYAQNTPENIKNAITHSTVNSA
ncbi:hypothetical protein GJ496_004661 [Pomphorhynchus laevis]|nr:hypothetical protein GJ496_004661 [Pomphorhynchus laevis]